MIKFTHLILILVASLGLAACESDNSALERLDNAFLKRDPQKLIDAGATRLDADQSRNHVSGNTEFWTEGSLYYNPDGELELVWRKIKSTGSWKVTADGKVCLTAPTWKRCHYYLALDGAITTVVRRKTDGVKKVVPGNQSLR